MPPRRDRGERLKILVNASRNRDSQGAQCEAKAACE